MAYLQRAALNCSVAGRPLPHPAKWRHVSSERVLHGDVVRPGVGFALALLLWSVHPMPAHAQDQAAARMYGDPSVSVGGGINVQPEGHVIRTVYLTGPLGGVGGVVAFGGHIPLHERLTVNGEPNIGWIHGEQSGRLVPGGGGNVTAVEAVVSGLLGFRVAPSFEALVGAGWSFASPERGFDIGNAGGFAMTAGFSRLHRVRSPVAVVTSFRYSFVQRPHANAYVGLGPHILRLALSIRLNSPKRHADSTGVTRRPLAPAWHSGRSALSPATKSGPVATDYGRVLRLTHH